MVASNIATGATALGTFVLEQLKWFETATPGGKVVSSVGTVDEGRKKSSCLRNYFSFCTGAEGKERR